MTPSEFDRELNLSIPPDAHCSAILVDVDVEPRHAECLIYGTMANGSTSFVKLKGGHSQVSLPFASRKVFLKYLSEPQHIRIGTIGYHN